MRLVLIDANLTVLWAAGLSDPRMPEQHKRARRYDRRDFEMLAEHIAGYDGFLFIPNALTEASNLLVQGLHEPLKATVLDVLKQLISQASERVVPSRVATQRPEYHRLGLADAALIEAAGQNAILLTDDQGLYFAAASAGRPVINFSHMKAER